MDKEQFLDKRLIHNYDFILDLILNHGREPSVLLIENMDDLISILNYNDKKREANDPELKMAVFTVIKGLLDSGKVELWWEYCWVVEVRESPPKTQDELFIYLDKYWDKKDQYGYGREYLLWFNKTGNKIGRGKI